MTILGNLYGPKVTLELPGNVYLDVVLSNTDTVSYESWFPLLKGDFIASGSGRYHQPQSLRLNPYDSNYRIEAVVGWGHLGEVISMPFPLWYTQVDSRAAFIPSFLIILNIIKSYYYSCPISLNGLYLVPFPSLMLTARIFLQDYTRLQGLGMNNECLNLDNIAANSCAKQACTRCAFPPWWSTASKTIATQPLLGWKTTRFALSPKLSRSTPLTRGQSMGQLLLEWFPALSDQRPAYDLTGQDVRWVAFWWILRIPQTGEV